MNSCIFIGRLTDDPVLEKVGDTHVTKFSIAVGRKFKSKGKTVDEVNYLDMVAWDKGAESIVEYFKKGKPIIVYCSAKQERWTDNTTQKGRSRIVFRVEKFEFPPSNARDDVPESSEPASESSTPSEGGEPKGVDDIPF